MKDYALFVESGPRHKTTMVHVPELLGCVAVGRTTEDAVAATPDAIRTYRDFLASIGQRVPSGNFNTHIAEHLTKGEWMGHGSPAAHFARDDEPVSPREQKLLLARVAALREALAAWAEAADKRSLGARPDAGSRAARDILLHVMPGPGNYLSPFVGGVKGFSALHSAAERGEVPIPDGFRRIGAMFAEIVEALTPDQRKAIVKRPNDTRTLRKVFRRALEHDWEHLAQLRRLT